MYENQNTFGVRTSANGTNSDPKTDESISPTTNKNALMKLKSYLIALRVWSLSASIIPTILGKCSLRNHQVPAHSPASNGEDLKLDPSHVISFTS